MSRALTFAAWAGAATFSCLHIWYFLKDAPDVSPSVSRKGSINVAAAHISAAFAKGKQGWNVRRLKNNNLQAKYEAIFMPGSVKSSIVPALNAQCVSVSVWNHRIPQHDSTPCVFCVSKFSFCHAASKQSTCFLLWTIYFPHVQGHLSAYVSTFSAQCLLLRTL